MLRFISLDDSDLRALGKKVRTTIQAQGNNEKNFRKIFHKLAAGGGEHMAREKMHELVRVRRRRRKEKKRSAALL